MAPTAVGAEEEAALAKALEDAERANQEVRACSSYRNGCNMNVILHGHMDEALAGAERARREGRCTPQCLCRTASCHILHDIVA
jgi:hypothetical protein